MANKKETKRGGFYFTAEGKPMLSVTEILKVIDRPALRYWFGQEVFYAMVKNPSLNEKEALSAPYQSSQKSASRGTTVHSIVEVFKTTYKEGGFDTWLASLPEDFRGYGEAFYKFMQEVKPHIIEQEKTVFDNVNRVAGTLDMYAKIGDAFYVLDVKTGKSVYPESELQLSAYANMLRSEGKKVDAIAVLLLETGNDKKPTGNFVFKTATENLEVFLHAKALYEWMNKERLIKAGYLTG